MSDGPFKSLPLGREWRLLAQCAINPASSKSDLNRVLAAALRRCDQRLPVDQARRHFGDDAVGLFASNSGISIENLRRTCPRTPLNRLFFEELELAIEQGKTPDDAIRHARQSALLDEQEAQLRGIVEVSQRENAAIDLRELRDCLRQIGPDVVMNIVTELGPEVVSSRTRHDGLDEGPEL